MAGKVNGKIPVIGFIGIGNMGRKMVHWLLSDGYPMLVYDIDPEKLDIIRSKGAMTARDCTDVVLGSDIVMTSLPLSEVWVDVAEKYLVPNAKKGQIFIDMGTVTPSETRRLSAVFKEKGAVLIDSPVSNSGPTLDDRLYIFAAGEKEAVDACMPLFETMGIPGHIVYCGLSGNGQIVKGVNQLSMGLVQAAFIETIGFGIRAGVNPEVIMKAIGDEGKPGFRGMVYDICKHFVDGNADKLVVKHGQLQHYIGEAREKGFMLPLSEALYDFLKDGEYTIRDANRMSPSFWNEFSK